MDIYGQEDVKFERLTRNEGLSHNTVTSILQDRYGFVWIGTKDGLNRFDGFNFEQFYNEPTDSNSIISGNISSIFESSTGSIWFGTYANGLDQYDPLLNKFRHYSFDEKIENGLSSNLIRQVKEDTKGNLWIATIGGGLNYLNLQSGEFKKLIFKPNAAGSLSSNDIYAIEPDSLGNLWIGSASSLEYLDVKSGKISHFIVGYESFDQAKPVTIKCLLLAKNNILWVGTSNGLYTYNPRNKEFYIHRHNLSDETSICDNNINALFQDTNESIWIGTEYGLARYIPEKNNFRNHYMNVNDNSGISSNKITCLYEDRSNILWVGTKGGGLNKLDLKRKKFYNIHSLFRLNNSLHHPGLNALAGDALGDIWMGSDGSGISIFNRKKLLIQNPGQNFGNFTLLSDDQILSLIKSKRKIYIGMQTGGLNILEKRSNAFHIEKYIKKGDSTGIANNQVNSLLLDKDGFLWIGTKDGLNKLIDTTKSGKSYFITYRNNYNDLNSIAGNEITALYQDYKGFIWIGTSANGIDRLNELTGKIDHYIFETRNTGAIGSNSINTIFEDHLGIIWIGTSGGGLNMLNADSRTFTRFTVKEGLPSNDIMAVLEDHVGILWISTSKGLSKFDPVTRQVTNFDISDGLLNDGFNASSAYQDDEGWMYFGTGSGLIYFHPSQIILNQNKPDIVISKLNLLNGKDWLRKGMFISKFNSKENKLILDYINNIFSIEFVAMDFTMPGKNKFQYKIEGLNTDWIDYGNKRSIMVANLEPGSYVLRIRGTNNDNVLNEEGLSLSIIVKPPFWKRNEFYLILIVLAGLIFIAIYSFLIKHRTNKLLAAKNHELELANTRLRESEKSLVELNHTKDKFFSIIAHDLRNPFNPLLALTELLDDDYHDITENERISFIKEIRIGAKKLHDLLENLLNWALSQTKQIKFNPKALDLSELIHNAIDLMSITAEKKGIVIKTNASDGIFVFADENMLNSTIRNLLNNAIKFSEDNSLVEINVFEETDFCTVEVKDFGPGISSENLLSIFTGLSSKTSSHSKGKGSGLGLILCKEFAEKNGGAIWAESEIGKGSSFFFTLRRGY